MKPPATEWYREQSEHNRLVYELLHAAWPDEVHDWKVVALFYSGLHRVNYWLAGRTGRAPASHFERNRRVKDEVRQVFSAYRDLCLMSLRARYHDGLRTRDDHRSRALALLIQLEAALPFA